MGGGAFLIEVIFVMEVLLESELMGGVVEPQSLCDK